MRFQVVAYWNHSAEPAIYSKKTIEEALTIKKQLKEYVNKGKISKVEIFDQQTNKTVNLER